jgi:hypothetical protein
MSLIAKLESFDDLIKKKLLCFDDDRLKNHQACSNFEIALADNKRLVDGMLNQIVVLSNQQNDCKSSLVELYRSESQIKMSVDDLSYAYRYIRFNRLTRTGIVGMCGFS